MTVHVGILLFAALAACYLAAMAFAYFQADTMLFPAPPPSYGDDGSIEKLRTPEGDQIATLHLPGAPGAPLLLYSHGNGEDLGYIRPLLETFHRSGIAVLSYDYPGYGQSSGQPSESGCYAAAESVYRHAVDKLGYPPEKIVLYGRSLGGGPACWLAERHPVAGLILNGTFSSAFRVMTRIKLLPWDKFDNLDRLSKIDCPILMIHGKRDQIVPFPHALKNAERAGSRTRTLWVEQAGHNNLIETAGTTYWETTVNFIRNPQDHGQ